MCIVFAVCSYSIVASTGWLWVKGCRHDIISNRKQSYSERQVRISLKWASIMGRVKLLAFLGVPAYGHRENSAVLMWQGLGPWRVAGSFRLCFHLRSKVEERVTS